jgi:hypothetical protein
LRSMSARVRAPHTVVTSPTAMYGSILDMTAEHPRRRDPVSSARPSGRSLVSNGLKST